MKTDLKSKIESNSKFYRVQNNGLVMTAFPFLALVSGLSDLGAIAFCLFIFVLSGRNFFTTETKFLLKKHLRYRVEVVGLNVISLTVITFYSSVIGVLIACLSGIYIGFQTIRYSEQLLNS